MNIELISINPHQTHHAAKCIYIYEIIQLEPPPPNINVFCIVYIYICVNICKHKTIYIYLYIYTSLILKNIMCMLENQSCYNVNYALKINIRHIYTTLEKCKQIHNNTNYKYTYFSMSPYHSLPPLSSFCPFFSTIHATLGLPTVMAPSVYSWFANLIRSRNMFHECVPKIDSG